MTGIVVEESLLGDAGAVLSEDRAYRYRLWRRWGTGDPLTFVMLNPSVADAVTDDRTIRQCVKFARREGCDSIEVVNLFAWRATDPTELLAAPDPVGPANRAELEVRLDHAGLARTPVVAAWGATAYHPGYRELGAPDVVAMARAARVPLLCLGVTATGAPRHPSRLPDAAPLEPWPGHPRK